MSTRYFVAFFRNTVLLMLISLGSESFAQQEKILLSEAVVKFKSITPETPIQSRLDLYGQIIRAVDTIEKNHSATDVGLALLSNGKFGEFDVNTIKSRYVSELISYFDKVCEVSPSFLCLGFISLERGDKQCLAAKSADEIVSAAYSLQNAVKIFSTQKNSESYVPLALTAFRGCREQANQKYGGVVRDRITFRLIDTLLELGDIKRATGLAQQLESPYFKFEAALTLKNKSNEPITPEYIDRLSLFASQKITGVNNALARLSLGTHAINLNPPYVNSTSLYQFAEFVLETDPQILNCKDGIQEEYFDALVLYMFNVSSLKVKGLDQHKSRFFGNSMLNDLNDLAGKSKIFQGCSKNYLTALKSITLLLAANRHEQAKSFHDRFKQAPIPQDRIALIDYYLELLPYSGVPNQKNPLSITKVVGSPGIPVDFLGFHHEFKEATFSLFKMQVQRGEICNASSVLFKNVKKTQFFDPAIKFFAESKLSPNTKPKCGDEDLELLLR